MIEVTQLRKKFGDFVAIDGVDLSVNAGESFALLGPNGAGKTTLIKILCTLLRPTSGTVKIDDYDIVEDEEEIKRRIGVVSHNSFLYDELSARENLEFYENLYGISDSDKINSLLEMANLLFRADDPVGTFSRGMKQRLAIIRSLLHDPELLLLDEPTTGLDVKSKRAFYRMIKDQNEKGKTILLATHHLDEAEKLCQKAAIIDQGKIIRSGAIAEIKSEVESLEEAFLRLTEGGKG
ncbi:MAG: heme ABC exporter ATP-binding protein CcmA [Candidatus Hydrothermarchaeales archaeon]